MNRILHTTEDGSHTLYVPELNEHYHSTHGALTESLHIFIQSGLMYWTDHTSKKEIVIFEAGFGTGLNALLTLQRAEELALKVHYFGIEKYPVTDEEIDLLNYPEILPKETHNLFKQLHACEWGTDCIIQANFVLHKIKDDLSTFDFSKLPDFDLVYFDAFAPLVQPKLWTTEIFKALHDKLRSKGVLTTYSAKGDVKRALREAGFELARLPGPPGKKHIIRAVTSGYEE